MGRLVPSARQGAALTCWGSNTCSCMKGCTSAGSPHKCLCEALCPQGAMCTSCSWPSECVHSCLWSRQTPNVGGGGMSGGLGLAPITWREKEAPQGEGPVVLARTRMVGLGFGLGASADKASSLLYASPSWQLATCLSPSRHHLPGNTRAVGRWDQCPGSQRSVSCHLGLGPGPVCTGTPSPPGREQLQAEASVSSRQGSRWSSRLTPTSTWILLPHLKYRGRGMAL